MIIETGENKEQLNGNIYHLPGCIHHFSKKIEVNSTNINGNLDIEILGCVTFVSLFLLLILLKFGNNRILWGIIFLNCDLNLSLEK